MYKFCAPTEEQTFRLLMQETGQVSLELADILVFEPKIGVKMVNARCGFCLLTLALMTFQSSAQDVTCLNQLIPCLNYLNSSRNPSSDCCGPLRSIIETNPQCLCNNLNSNAASGQNGINVTEVLLLPTKCGINVNAATCPKNSPRQSPRSSSPTTRTSVPSSAGGILPPKLLLGAALTVAFQLMWD